jgi:hypothetical protein
MISKIFKEQDGLVTHTAASKLLSESPAVAGLVGIQVGEYFPSATKVCKARTYQIFWEGFLYYDQN